MSPEAQQGLGFEEFHKKEGFGYRMPKGVFLWAKRRISIEERGKKLLRPIRVKAADLNENRICNLNFLKLELEEVYAQGGCKGPNETMP